MLCVLGLIRIELVRRVWSRLRRHNQGIDPKISEGPGFCNSFVGKIPKQGRWTMSNFSFSCRLNTRFGFLTLIALLMVLSSTLASSQTTVAQGSIQGTVTDPSGAVV